jgi:hypothetical protein
MTRALADRSDQFCTIRFRAVRDQHRLAQRVRVVQDLLQDDDGGRDTIAITECEGAYRIEVPVKPMYNGGFFSAADLRRIRDHIDRLFSD